MPATDRIEPTASEGPQQAAEEAAPKAAKTKAAGGEAKARRAPKRGGAAQKAAKEAPKAEEAAQPQGKPKEAQPQERGKAARGAGQKAAVKEAPKEELSGYVPRLKERYRKEIVPALIKELGLGNPMQVPRVTKVVINMGLGEALTNPKALESAERDLTAITGQKPVVTKAKKSIAQFKIRQGMSIGMMVTLRGHRMYEFLDRMINVALPRIRDFRGAPTNGFDGRGNYSMGFREHVVFPEIDFNTIDKIRGLQMTIGTTAETDDQARRLLTLMGVAFARDSATGE